MKSRVTPSDHWNALAGMSKPLIRSPSGGIATSSTTDSTSAPQPFGVWGARTVDSMA